MMADSRRTRGAYRKEERVQLPEELQRRLVDTAARKYGTAEKLAKALSIPKSSAHYYRSGRLTMPRSVLERMLAIAAEPGLEEEVRAAAIAKDRTWANAYAASINREKCRQRLRLPTKEELRTNDHLRRKAAAIVSYVMAEGSIWIRDDKDGEGIVNITFADHETDLYEHFRSLCKDVFDYDIGRPQPPGNGARAIRGFIYSRFVAEWLMANGVVDGEKSAKEMHIPDWIMESRDTMTMIAALQTWCDGEGSIRSNKSIEVVQSAHTGLSIDDIPRQAGNAKHGYVTGSRLSDINYGNSTVRGYCEVSSRSAVLDDLMILSIRLGLRPKMRISRICIKNDDYWSCIWAIVFDADDTKMMLRYGAIRQQRKRGRIAL